MTYVVEYVWKNPEGHDHLYEISIRADSVSEARHQAEVILFGMKLIFLRIRKQWES